MIKKIPILALLALAPLTVFGGQSLVLTPGATSSAVNDPNPGDISWRAEFQLHDWVAPSVATSDGYIWDLNGLGASAAILNSGTLRISDKRDSVAPSVCDLSLNGRTNILVRIQRDTTTSKFTCELWNYNGSGYASSVLAIGSHQPWQFSGGRFGSAYTTARLGFFRVHRTVVPEGGRPPTTASTEAAFTNFRFDGNTQDTSGNGHNMTFPSVAFANTPDQIPAAILRTSGAPAWSDWVSVRAGFPATLDGSGSYSLADAGDAVTYRWQQLAGPTTLRWSDRSAARPVVRGLIFGTYKVRLLVTDASGKSTSTDLAFGAVATDDNGVVVNANPDADKLFGPMIAFGKNPWPWADQMTLRSAQVRSPQLQAISPPGWGVDLPGTISYTPGFASQPQQTTIASALSASATEITVTDASKLDLSSLPTVLMLHAPGVWAPIEEVRVCSASGRILQICYDGRAWRAGVYERVAAPQAWAVGTTVRQVKSVGVGSTFVTDFCPAGPGEGGLIQYNTGTVSVTPGSNAVTGSGTSWASTLDGQRIRIAGTHDGQPFAFFSTVRVTSANTLVLSRPWPSGADAGTSLAYAVLQASRYIVRGWRRPDGTTGRNTMSVSSCESDTQIYHTEIFSSVNGAQVSQVYGYLTFSWFSEFGPNYYDEVLAHYAGYLRSGYTMFRDNARMVGDYWAQSPDFDEGWNSQLPRRTAATGMVAAAILDGRTSNWYAIRRLASSAIGNPFSGGAVISGCDSDIRETAYALSWIALAALFDPVDTGDPSEPNQRSYWKAQLARAYTRDQGCKGANNEFPQAYWGGKGAYAVTSGSATVKGTDISPSLCSFAGGGSINVTNGVTAATGSAFNPAAKIVILGKRLGQPYLFYSRFTVNSSNSITMASPWDGDSGTYSYQTETDLNWLAFAEGVADHATMNHLYACQWVDSTTVRLDRPWEGSTGTVQAYRANELGFGQEPFLEGIKVFAMKLASLGATGPTASGYANLAAATANHILTTGFDTLTGGLHYARGWPGCEPKLNPRLNCSYGANPAEMEASRTLNAEAQNAIRVAYEANPTAETRQFGDQFYGSQWGKLGGPYFDNIYLTALDNDATWSYKWLGFLFGIGMSHQWPAVRLGGLQPEVRLTPSVAFNQTSVPGSVSARVRVTRPSGAEAIYSCTTSPCTIEVDARQGAHIYRIEYLDSRGVVLAVGDPEILETR